jgi:ABC-type amino acid transport substrate-binding protein
MKIKCLILLITVSVSISAKNNPVKKSLICNFGDYNAEPYSIISKNGNINGIIKDVCDKIAKELNVKSELKNIPRLRAESLCLKGKTNLIITARPQWLPKLANVGHWMPSIIRTNYVLIYNSKKTSDIKTLEELKGKSLGTILGYRYSAKINNMLKKKELFRENASTLENSLGMLTYDRVHAVITEEILFNYIKSKNSKFKNLLSATANVEKSYDLTPVLCPKSPFDPKTVENAFNKLIKNNTIKKILKKYN